MSWAMRYTFHTGYEPPRFVPQFQRTLGVDDPVALVRFAAEQGIAGVLYPWARDRPASEVERVSVALRESGLAGSCVVVGNSSVLFQPIWTDMSPNGRALLEAEVGRSCATATALNASVVVAFPVGRPARQGEPERQRDNLVANLTVMGRLAREHGCSIGIEPMVLPGLLLQSVDAALDVVRRVGSADVGLIFDTAHVATMHGEVMPRFREAYDHIVLLQFADLPGRVEPGAGTLDLVEVAADAIVRGYAGLVDLEHGWVDPSLQGEADGRARLRAFDERVRAAVSAERNAVTSVSARPN